MALPLTVFQVGGVAIFNQAVFKQPFVYRAQLANGQVLIVDEAEHPVFVFLAGQLVQGLNQVVIGHPVAAKVWIALLAEEAAVIRGYAQRLIAFVYDLEQGHQLFPYFVAVLAKTLAPVEPLGDIATNGSQAVLLITQSIVHRQ